MLFQKLYLIQLKQTRYVMHMFLEVILLAEIRNIDPFDQPGVEERKIMAKSLLTMIK